MKCAVCTLFERDYHLGVAAFVNSLCTSGFRGTVYAGFRGPLPPWAERSAQAQPHGHTLLEVMDGVRLVFMPLNTPAHLTNYKPDFMLQVEALAAAETDALIYCDPDLLIDVEWEYIVDWLSCGIAVCEDVNSPMPENHPTRVGWRRFFKQFGHDLQFRASNYANGGFVGLTWNYRKILPLWQEFMVHIAKLLGGGNVAGIIGGKWLPGLLWLRRLLFQNRPRRPQRDLRSLPGRPLQLPGTGSDGISQRPDLPAPRAWPAQAVG